LTDLRITLGEEEFAQIVDRAETKLLDDGREAAFEEIILVVFKHDAYVSIDMRLKKSVVLREDLRDCRLTSHRFPS
jgi:hypothetical protein